MSGNKRALSSNVQFVKLKKSRNYLSFIEKRVQLNRSFFHAVTNAIKMTGAIYGILKNENPFFLEKFPLTNQVNSIDFSCLQIPLMDKKSHFSSLLMNLESFAFSYLFKLFKAVTSYSEMVIWKCFKKESFIWLFLWLRSCNRRWLFLTFFEFCEN